MSINYKPVQNEYKKISLFKGWCLTNFPFIEEDFDALTIYELICKIKGYLNDVIKNQNLVEQDMTNLFNTYQKLETYINTYFDNLDVQEEVNNKLDEMVADGTFDRIINDTLFNQIHNDIKNLKSNDTIFIGDSYAAQSNNSWVEKVAEKMGLTIGTNAFKVARSGYGFARVNQQFLTLLQDYSPNITEKDKIKNIIVCGGLNDINATDTSTILYAITLFTQYCNQTYPNAHVYIGMIGWHENSANASIRSQVLSKVLPAYQNCGLNSNATFLEGTQYIMHFYGFYGADASHPSDTGEHYLADAIYNSLKSPYMFNTSLSTTQSETGVYIENMILNNKLLFRLYGNITSGLPDTLGIGEKTINLGPGNTHYMRPVNNYSNLHCTIMLNYNNETYITTTGRITINSDGNLILSYYNTHRALVTAIAILDCQQEYNLLYF